MLSARQRRRFRRGIQSRYDRLIKKLGYVPGETVPLEEDKNDKGGDNIMDRGRDAVQGTKNDARGRMNNAVQGARGGVTAPKGKN